MYLFTMCGKETDKVMRNMMFWLLVLFVFLALAGC
jgi:hypothetical protein